MIKQGFQSKPAVLTPAHLRLYPWWRIITAKINKRAAEINRAESHGSIKEGAPGAYVHIMRRERAILLFTASPKVYSNSP